MSKEDKAIAAWASLCRAMYALGLAQIINASPFHFNPHKLPHSEYRCVKCWESSGTRYPCEHRIGR